MYFVEFLILLSSIAVILLGFTSVAFYLYYFSSTNWILSLIRTVTTNVSTKGFSTDINFSKYSRVVFSPNYDSERLTVGEIVTARIELLENVTCTDNTAEVAYPHLITEADKIKIEVKHHLGEFLVPVVQKDIIGNEITAEFLVEQSGLYDIKIFANGENIFESFKEFTPEVSLDVSQTELIGGILTAPVLTVLGKAIQLCVETKDRFGNLCKTDDIMWKRFFLRLYQGDKDKIVIFDDFLYSTIFNQDRLIISCEIYQAGIYQANICYDDQIVKNGSFQVLTVTPEEDICISNFTTQRIGTKLFSLEAELLEESDLLIANNFDIAQNRWNANIDAQQQNLKTVDLTITPELIYLSSELHKFKSCPSTRIWTFKLETLNSFQVLHIDPVRDLAVFEVLNTIEEQAVELMSPIASLRIMMGIFSIFLRRKASGISDFKAKRENFYSQLRKRHRDIEGLSRTFEVQKNNILSSTYRVTQYFNNDDWCKKFTVKFSGEFQSKCLQEFYQHLFTEIFGTDQQGMFSSFGYNGLVHPNPDNILPKQSRRLYDKMWELAGRIVGKCIHESSLGAESTQMVCARFTRSFLAQILGLSPNYTHIEQDDPNFYMESIQGILKDNMDAVNSTKRSFTEKEYDFEGQVVKEVALVDSGAYIRVTTDNKIKYLNALARYRLATRMENEIQAFLRGLYEIVPLKLLSVFDENELELLICGASIFSAEDLQKHSDKIVHIPPLPVEEKILEWFWNSVTEMSEESKGRFLQFITGSSLLPEGRLSNLIPGLQIEVVIDKVYNKLPTAHVNSNLIRLQNHENFESFNNALITAINNGIEGFSISSS